MQRSQVSSSGEDDVARKAASDANALASNARQMVLNRDPTLQELQATASTATEAIMSSADDRAGLHSQLDALDGRVGALPLPVTVISTGQGKTAALLAVGASVDLTVNLSRAMPTAAYQVEIMPISASLIMGNATVVVKSKTKTTITLTVTAVVAVAASSVVSVIAWG